ncbi:hypothetical protein HY492_00615 [Candidatus Woesearchaeota archaeon]|nr:hypothetical protein [Candidatus Woesearchaeota archaeon]
MDPRIKEDILSVLQSTIDALTSNNFVAIGELSNHTIHDASIYQDEDSVSTAILIYAIGKIVQRCTETSCPVPPVSALIERARDALARDKDGLFHAAFSEAFDLISKHDAHLKLYIEEVLNKARVKKGSKLYEHGISVARIADMLGLSQWELYSYLGKTTMSEDVQTSGVKRLQLARELFR